jgi:dihydrofolate reductase
MIVSLIVAASDNEVIGANGALPWHLPEDMRRFRRLTTGHVVVMGRLTYESVLARLGTPLPGRTSVVVSRSAARHAPPSRNPAASPASGNAAASPASGNAAASPASPASADASASLASRDATAAPASKDATAAPASGDAAASGTRPGQVRWAESVPAALDLATALGAAAGHGELFVAGGVTVYAGALPFADRIYLTRVHGDVAGDRSMPPGWLAGFRLARAEPVSDPAATLPYEWLDYERGSPGIATGGRTARDTR